jgi:hypothetical protein
MGQKGGISFASISFHLLISFSSNQLQDKARWGVIAEAHLRLASFVLKYFNAEKTPEIKAKVQSVSSRLSDVLKRSECFYRDTEGYRNISNAKMTLEGLLKSNQ